MSYGIIYYMAMYAIVSRERGIYKISKVLWDARWGARKNAAAMRDRSARRPAEERKPRGTEAQTLDEHS